MILDKITQAVAKRLEDDKRHISFSELERSLADKTPAASFKAAIGQPGLSVIAEIKKASPSAGDIRLDADVENIAHSYQLAGASAISVLTERDFFKGSLADLEVVASRVKLPLLRKDFIIDEYQILEAGVAGASAVLLITQVLPVKKLKNYFKLAESLGLDCLFEIHDKFELEKALEAGADIIGINNRDLKTFKVDINTSINLRKSIPPGVLCVSESGIKNRSDLQNMTAAGFDAVLVGEALMRSSDLGELLSVSKEQGI